MNLLKLKKEVDIAISMAEEYDVEPIDIPVSLQIDGPRINQFTYSSSDIELHYDNDLCASGCVLTAVIPEK